MWKRIKGSARHILSVNKSLYSAVEGLVIFIALIRVGNAIERSEHRQLRARILRYWIDKLKKAMRSVHYGQSILVTRGESYVFSNGIFLNLLGTNRYLKVVGDAAGNEGKKMSDFLASKGIVVKTMIDLGANFGEVSLYFSKENPSAKILAVEASPDNFKILKSNCSYQGFSTQNIILLNEAVSDKKGFVEITRGVNAENMVVYSGNKDAIKRGTETEKIASDTLASFMQRFGFTEVDFIKIDIEGSEPLLYDSFKERLGGIRSLLVEVGDKIDHRNYFPLIELLWNSGMECYERNHENKFASLTEIKQEILTSFASDLWFIQK